MTMAKRKLSTGGNIYFTLDNYGRKKAHKLEDGGPMFEADNFDVGDPGIAYGDMSDNWESDLSPFQAPKQSGFDEPKQSGFDKLKQFGQEHGSDIAEGAEGLGLAIGAISQKKYKQKHNLLKNAGITNYRGKYTFGNGGNLYAEGGGIGNALKGAGEIAALTAQNASIADTSELEGAIQDKGNVNVAASSNDELMNEWAAKGPDIKHVSFRDVRGQSAGKSFGNIMSAGAAGAKAGMKAGSIGAVAGAAAGILSSTFGAIAGRRKAKKKQRSLNKQIDIANQRNDESFRQRASAIDTNTDLAMANSFKALGGPLFNPYAGLGIPVSGPIEYDFMQQYLDTKQQQADNAGESSLSGLTFGKGGGIHINPKNKGKLTATSKRTGKSFSELAHSKNPLTRKRAQFALNARHFNHHKHAFGGDLESNGANWDLGFTSIGNGGTHEMNPYEGVQMGTDSKGIPNLVEQGEIVYNDYVFSNRLNATPDLLQAYNLPKKYKGMTFSDIASKISGETKERPNDPISQKGYEDQMERLIQAQEYVRQAQQQQQAIQQAALMQQAQQYAAQQQAQQQAYQNALAQQAYNNQQLGAMQGMVSPEEQMGLGQYGCGGGLKLACGGRKFSHGGKRGRLYDDGDWLLNPYNVSLGEITDAWRNNSSPYITNGGFEGDEYLGFPVASGTLPTDVYAVPVQTPDGRVVMVNPSNTNGTAPIEEEEDDEGGGGARKGKEDEDDTLPTWMRGMPTLGSAIGLGTSIFWKPNMDYANAIQAAADAAGRFERVGWNPVGNYLQYRPFDTQYALNQLNSQFGATNRAAINNANGNRATAMANLLASQHNYGNQVGGLYAQALQYNDAQRKATEEFNRATNLANSEGFLKADMANQSARQAAMNSKLQGTVYAQNMKNDLDVGRRNSIMQNLSGLFNNLGRMGDENFAANQARTNPNFIYYYDTSSGLFGKRLNGNMIYKTPEDTKERAIGGYLTMGNRRRSRRRK